MPNMKYAQIVGRPNIDEMPEFYELLADSSCVKEALMYDSNNSRSDRPVALYEVHGDIDRFREGLEDVPEVQEATTAPISEGQFNLLVVLDLTEASVIEDVLKAVTTEGLIVAKPVVYRNREVHARIVGSSSTLQKAVEDFPSEIDLDIVSVGEFDRRRESPVSVLSDRQREALFAAFDLGYYEKPRGSTHEDVALRLGCEPHTATEHLQKAESKILKEVLQEA
jgi:predicted DNA binding protein